MEQRMNRMVTMLAGAGLGAGLLYLLDPNAGARRRALARDQAAAAMSCARRKPPPGTSRPSKRRACAPGFHSSSPRRAGRQPCA